MHLLANLAYHFDRMALLAPPHWHTLDDIDRRHYYVAKGKYYSKPSL